MTHSSAAFLLAALLTSAVLAQEPAAPAAGQLENAPDISVELLCVSLPQAVALPIVRHFRSGEPGDRAKAMADLQQLLEKGTAKLIGWPRLQAHTAQKAEHHAQEEIRFATEFAAQGVSLYLSDKEGSLVDTPNVLKGYQTQPIAAAFETRNIGLSVEAEASLREDKSISVAVKAEHVRLKAVDRITIERITDKKSDKSIQEQPRFTSLKVETTLGVATGDPTLIGLFNIPEAEDSLELFVMTAEVVAPPGRKK